MNLPAEAVSPPPGTEGTSASERDKILSDYLHGPSQVSGHDDQEGSSSIFGANMPGVMTLEQVENEIVLDEWKIKIGNRITTLGVSSTPSSKCSND